MATRMKNEPIVGKLLTTKPNYLDLGVMQANLESAAKRMKKAQNQLALAQNEHIEAELAYDQANKALLQGVATVRENTKIKT